MRVRRKGALYVDTYVVVLRIPVRQCDRIFALAAAELEYDGAVVGKEITVPMPLEWMILVKYILERWLYEAFEGEILGESFQFVFSHGKGLSVG